MQKPQHFFKLRRSISSKFTARRQLAVLLVPLLLTIVVAAGVTFAFLFTSTKPLENKFTPAHVSCNVLEGDDGNTFDGVTKSKVRIENTGNTDAYIRAAVVITWVSDEGNKVAAVKPVAQADYSITYTKDAGWTFNNADGFWYYSAPVKVNDSTENLIESCTAVAGKAPDGFHLSVEIVASAIQSSPTTVVEEQWNVEVDETTGKITIN